MPKIRNHKNFYSGLMFMGFGLAALVISQSYAVGTASKMGPGYFPRALGALIVVLGALLSLLSLRSTQEPKIDWHWRPLAIILFSICLIPWLTDSLGIVLTSLLLVFVASTASEEFRWKEALISGVILGVASTALFVWGLAIRLPIWPAFIMGGAS